MEFLDLSGLSDSSDAILTEAEPQSPSVLCGFRADQRDVVDKEYSFCESKNTNVCKKLDKDFETTTKNLPLEQLNTPRSVYLITYSKADVLKVPDRKKFGEMIQNEFDPNSLGIVIQWVSAAEMHRLEGVHFHCAIKLKSPRRWKKVRENLCSKYGINVDFLGFHDTYYDAHQYVIKQDSHYVYSPGHVSLDNRVPKTAAAIRSKRVSEVAKTSIPSSKKLKSPRLDNSQVFHIITKNDLKTDNELCAFATKQMTEGNDELSRWIMNHAGKKARMDVIETAWQMVNAAKQIERANISRMDIIQHALNQRHRLDFEKGIQCKGEWLIAAIDVLNKNDIEVPKFAAMLRNALEQGRMKKNNIMIIGGTNRAKSFMFMPLMHMFDCFTCPSKSTFNWVGAPDKEIVFLNDFRYEKNVMEWYIFLNFLEGAPIQIAMPKNHYANDVTWSKKQPVFATGEKKIVRIVNNVIDEGETSQMDERWTYVKFYYQFKDGEINYDLVHCPRCFAELLLHY